MTLPIIQSLWIGDDLTNLEKLCIRSFIDHGHEFHLYTYADIGGIPDGTTIKDGNEVLPASKIFFRGKNKSVAAFSDWFRYELLAVRGGFWVDMDYVCLRPFDFPADIVFARNDNGYATSVIKFPARHECMTALAAACANTRHREKIGYLTFYRLLSAEIRRLGLEHYAVPLSTLLPLETDPLSLIFEAGGDGRFGKNTYGMHFADSMAGDLLMTFKNANFPPDSVYEKLKRKHAIPSVTDAPTFTHEQVSAMFIEIGSKKIQERENKNKKRKRKYYVIDGVSLLIGFLFGAAVFWWSP